MDKIRPINYHLLKIFYRGSRLIKSIAQLRKVTITVKGKFSITIVRNVRIKLEIYWYVSTSLYIFVLLSFIQKGPIIDNQRHGLETQAKTDTTRITNTIVSPSIPNPQYKKYLIKQTPNPNYR